MKQRTFLFWMILLGWMTLSTQAQIFTIVTGNVTDEATGEPVPGQEVIIDADSLYTSSVYTNESGFYVDTIASNQVVETVYIATLDLCSFTYHDTVVFNPPQGAVVVVDFEICTDSLPGGDCQALFNWSPSPANENFILFTDESTPAESIDSWWWSFGDGTGSGEQNPSHEYGSPGTYTVCLTITTSPDSCSSTFCTDIVVGNVINCQADFYYFTDSLNPSTIQFVDQSSPQNQIVSWYWEFGENSVSTEQNPTYTFGEPGTYPVCLTITAFDGADSCISTHCEDVVVGIPTGCQADFSWSPSPVNEHLILFTDQSTPAGNIVDWYWDFGDGTTSGEQNPTHEFGDAGTYEVCLTIVAINEVDSCISTFCSDVVIGTTVECQADFYYAVDSTNSGMVYFFDMSTPENLITSWSWDFGDGTFSADQNPVHTFENPGIFIVCLTIEAQTGDEPCISTACIEVWVQGTANFSLGGNVFAGMYQLDEGFAYAYKIDNGTFTEVYSQVIDTLGYYFFDLLAGDYYLKVEPTPNSVFFNDYLPTYYGDAIHWEDAELINLNQNMFTADINLVPLSAGINGNGSISGYIYHGGEKSGNPAADIQVMLANADGDYVGMIFSDEEGYFEFTDLANGMYTLYAEVVGKSITPKNYYLSDDHPHVTQVVMTIGAENIVFGVDELSSSYIDQIGDPYPNPVSGTLSMLVDVKKPTTLRIEILNMTGQTVANTQFNLKQSEHIRFDTESLNPGFYLLNIATEDNVKIIRRFIRK